MIPVLYCHAQLSQPMPVAISPLFGQHFLKCEFSKYERY